MSTPAIQAIGLTKHFRGEGGETVTAVDGIDLTIGSGEIVAFLGPNGAGKTTTVDMFLGLTSPTGGTVEVYGASPHRAVMDGPGLRRDADRRAAARLHGAGDRPRDRRAARAARPGRGRHRARRAGSARRTGW